MRRRHPKLPATWLLTDERMGDGLWAALRRLPRGSGVIVRHHALAGTERRRLIRRIRKLARVRGLVVMDDGHTNIARVHSARELRTALLRSPELIFLSPIHSTRTHPEWPPLPRMQAAAIARLSPRAIHALGGMTGKRFARVTRLGFAGFGAVDAWLRT